ncbi:septum formation family protein [Nocardia carnea]|uniref:septum formation family protein n=1 Tax=Nocardia carnea TaxID=37328 RepID=UPI00245474B3|nr:septum formation family protein [Nocardia carnea]
MSSEKEPAHRPGLRGGQSLRSRTARAGRGRKTDVARARSAGPASPETPDPFGPPEHRPSAVRSPRRPNRAGAGGSRRPGKGKPTRIPAPRLRWSLLAVAVGAIVAALLTLMVSGFDNDSNLQARTPGGAVAKADKVFASVSTGDCLTWTKPDHSDLVELDCAEEHLFEVTDTIDLSQYPGAEFGPDAVWPDSLRLTELREEHCVPAAQRYLNGKLDPRGKYAVGLMYPSNDGWTNSGDRMLRCGLQVPGLSGNPLPATGRVAESDQSKVYEPGVCLGISQNLPTDPVDCTQEHAVEIAATVDLSAKFPGGPPGKDEQDQFLEAECGRMTNDYLGGPHVLRDKTLTVFFDFIDARSWLAGSRKLNCMIGKGADQEGFAPIVGPARGRVLINGQEPVPPPNSGRSTPTPLPGAAPLPPQPEPRPAPR